jgi:hypothetical protein
MNSLFAGSFAVIIGAKETLGNMRLPQSIPVAAS